MTAARVLIHGIVFAAEEKAPFIASGQSVYGAIEFDPAQGKIKCHECGEWMESIGHHSATTHSLAAREYRRKYGLNAATTLDCPAFRERRIKEVRSRGAANAQHLKPQRSGQAGANEYQAQSGRRRPVTVIQ